MQLELSSASNFLVHLVRLARRNVSESQLARFHECLIDVLSRRYRDHWFPDKPFKGSGYRCIRINGKFDPLIGEAGVACGLSTKFLHAIFPSELTLWVDPKEVSYRIGENGSICVLYEQKSSDAGKSEPWRPSLTATAAAVAPSSAATTANNGSQHSNGSSHHHHQQQLQQHNNKQKKQLHNNVMTSTPTSNNQNMNKTSQQQQHLHRGVIITDSVVNNKAGKRNMGSSTNSTTSPSCRTSMDFILDRKSVSIEQLAAFVSS